MAFAARILLFGSEPSRSRGLADKLTEQGYHNMLAGTIEDVLAMAKNEHPDLVIVQASLNGSGGPEHPSHPPEYLAHEPHARHPDWGGRPPPAVSRSGRAADR